MMSMESKNEAPVCDTAEQVLEKYEAMLRKKGIGELDASEPEHTTLEAVLGNLEMRHNIQDIYGDARANLGNILLLGQYLSRDDKRLFVQVLCLMGIICLQMEYLIPNKVIGTDYKRGGF